MAKIKKAKEARVNMADKMKYESRLMGNIAEWMISHGTVKSDRERSNEYTGVRIAKVCWRGHDYSIIWVDGMTCQIEKQ